MSIIIVGGTFNDDGGKPSGWVDKFAQAIKRSGRTVIVFNGGYWEDLSPMLALPEQAFLFWFADIPNDKPKFVNDIKKLFPKILLVTSKRNLNNEYSFQDLISRAITAKANLLLEFTGSRSSVEATIMDPLGNVFLHKETDIVKVADTLMGRLFLLSTVQRVSSSQIGETIAAPHTPEILEFIDIVKKHAEEFHTLIHGANTTRMLGNASFRCERGFPSFRVKRNRLDDLIFVSRRNVDKRFISTEAFVAVRAQANPVEYYGEYKPSVDTPVQLALYEMYPDIRFILHSHTYIDGAPFTKSVLPCGALEEAGEILKVHPDSMLNAAINIRGHGSICLSSSIEFLRSICWKARPMPEFV